MKFESEKQNISWISNRYREGNLELKPSYQRKPVWALRQKCYLVESVLLGFPVPEVYMQATTTPEGVTTYDVVDGQQRIRALLQFIGNDKDAGEQDYNVFALEKLDVSSEYLGMTFDELSDDDKKQFWSYNITIRILHTSVEEEIREMFRRLNKNLTPLKPQELRNATYSGPFVKLSLELADEAFWAVKKIVSTAAIRRMADVEYVSELLIGTLHGPQGGSAKIVDSYYQKYEDYEEDFPSQRSTEKLFRETLKLIESFNALSESRWSNKTDFYTLFVTLASLLRDKKLKKSGEKAFWSSVQQFGLDVDSYLTNSKKKVRPFIISYSKAVEKGVNDKARRGDRHIALLEAIGHFFE